MFNAVRTHQKKMEEEVKRAGGSERKRAKLMSSVSKRDFIDVLRNMEGAKGGKNPAGKATKSKQVSFTCEKKMLTRYLLNVMTLLMCLLFINL